MALLNDACYMQSCDSQFWGTWPHLLLGCGAQVAFFFFAPQAKEKVYTLREKKK